MEIKRDYLWDNIKALLIFLVVLGHCLEASSLRFSSAVMLDYWIYSFHMPAFLFASGFWAKSYCKNGKVRAEKLGVLMGYYLVFQLLFSLFKLIANVKVNSMSLFNPSRGLWYLLALAAFYMLVPLAERIKPYVLLPILVIFAVLIGKDKSPSNYLAILRIFVFAPYFFSGYYMSGESVKKLRSVKAALRYPAAAVLAAASALIWIMQRDVFTLKIFFGKASYGEMGLGFLEGSALRLESMVIASMMIAAVIMVMPSVKMPFSYIGTNSLQIFIYHMALVILLRDSGLLTPVIDSPAGFVIAIAAAAAVTLLLSPSVLGVPFKWIQSGVKKLFKQ